jgi:hypothetical protein
MQPVVTRARLGANTTAEVSDPEATGFRPGRSCEESPRKSDTWNARPGGRSGVLLTVVATLISDGPVLRCSKASLQQDNIKDMVQWRPMAGTPQGAVIGRLLANHYLRPLDLLVEESAVAGWCARRAGRRSTTKSELCLASSTDSSAAGGAPSRACGALARCKADHQRWPMSSLRLAAYPALARPMRRRDTPMRKPTTEALCAGEPHTRIGGRGGRKPFSAPVDQPDDILDIYGQEGADV